MGIQSLKMPHARRGADLNAEADGINHAEPDCALSTVSTELTKERKVPKERKRCDYYFSSKDLTCRLRTNLILYGSVSLIPDKDRIKVLSELMSQCFGRRFFVIAQLVIIGPVLSKKVRKRLLVIGNAGINFL